MKKAITLLLVFLVGTSVLASTAIPHHHHHHGSEAACLANDCDRHKVCGNAETDADHASNNDCCAAKYLSLSPSSLDSRKEHLCDCRADDPFHSPHYYPLILSETPEITPAPCWTLTAGYDFFPVGHTSLPAILFGGLRAPPAV